MSLLEQFEDSNKEVYQVTQNEWVNIMIDYFTNSCGYNSEDVIKHNIIEFKFFHQEQVERALKSNLDVSEEVISEYPSLIIKINNDKKIELERIERLNSIPELTESMFKLLNVGNKITVNGTKLTIHAKEDQSIIARIYRKQNKAVKLSIGDRYNLAIGWN